MHPQLATAGAAGELTRGLNNTLWTLSAGPGPFVLEQWDLNTKARLAEVALDDLEMFSSFAMARLASDLLIFHSPSESTPEMEQAIQDRYCESDSDCDSSEMKCLSNGESSLCTQICSHDNECPLDTLCVSSTHFTGIPSAQKACLSLGGKSNLYIYEEGTGRLRHDDDAVALPIRVYGAAELPCE